MMTKRLRVLLLAGVAVLSMAAFYADSSTDSSDNSDKNNEDTNSDNGTNSSGSFDTAGDADAA